MNFSPDTNLTQRSTIAVISSLWNKEDIIADINCFLEKKQFRKSWTDIESKVMLHLRKIVLPNVLKLNLENLVEPMGMQLFKWISLTQSLPKTFQPLPATIRFFWTERGTLDYVKTAVFIMDRCHDKTFRFCLACLFCIEKTIYELWSDVSPTMVEKMKLNPMFIESVLVLFWVYFLSGNIETLMVLTEYCGVKDAYEFAFLFVLDLNCLSALRYFLERVQPDRQKKVVHMALQSIFRSSRPREGNILMFLFSYLEESDINQIILRNTHGVLDSLLEWPCQEFFMPVARSSWNSLSSLEYLNLFQDIVECVCRYSGDLYKDLAKEFWQVSPSPHKEYVISKCVSGTFLSRLFLYENTYEIIQMIFGDCSADQRLRMIFYFEGMNVCDLLVKREKWDSLKLFVTSCIPTREVLEEFIMDYETVKPCYCTKETELRTVILKEKIRDWF